MVDGSGSADRVELILERVETLPTLGPVAARLLTLTSSDDYEVDEVCSLIETDPSLTAKVLALCRHGSTRLADRTTTVRRALLALGIERVRSAVLSVSVYELMDRAGHESDLRLSSTEQAPIGSFDREGFWTHSIGVACASELIVSGQPELGVRPDDAFVAGLLHDLGRLALDVILPRAHERVIGMADRRRCASATVEREVFGLDHHQIGRRLAEHWGLPEHLSDVMWLHSQPRDALPMVEHRALISMVSVAKALARELHIGWSGDFDQPRSWAEAAEDAGLDPSLIEAGLGKVHEQTASRCSILGLGEPTSPDLLLRSIVEANRTLGRMNALLVSRQREAEEMRRRVEQLEAFGRSVHAGMSASAVLAEIVASARRTLGPDAAAGLLEQGGQWQWHPPAHAGAGSEPGHTDEAELAAGTSVNRPDSGEGQPDAPGPQPRFVTPPESWDPRCLGDQPVAAVGDPVAAVAPWITPELGPEPGQWRVLGLTVQGDDRGGRAVLLIRGKDAAGLGRRVEGAARLWASALGGAIQRERMRRYGEMLASANRALVEAQRAIAERESMARLGELTAGAAHEMNNPLAVISGRAQLLRRHVRDDVSMAAASAIAEAASDLSEMISDLHMLAEPIEPGSAPLTVEQLLRDAKVHAAERAAGIDRVQIHSGPGLALMGDAALLRRAIEEVVVNALEASNHEIVTVRAETVGSDGRLLIVIEDSGPGFTDRALTHAVDPFFSDKPAGRKRGLGLSRTHRIIEAHRGTLTLENRPQGGARVAIELPEAHRTRAAA